MFSGRLGTGLVLARSQSGDGSWSPPSAVGTMGIGWGALVGGDITNYMIILNNLEALKAFSGKGNINVGAELDVAVGLLGRGTSGNVSAGDQAIASAYAYAHSKGFFAGVSLEGSVLVTRDDVNAKFYGRPVTSSELLFGNNNNLFKPKAAQPLYEALNKALEIPIQGFRPSLVVNNTNVGTGYYQTMMADNSNTMNGSGGGDSSGMMMYGSSSAADGIPDAHSSVYYTTMNHQYNDNSNIHHPAMNGQQLIAGQEQMFHQQKQATSNGFGTLPHY